MLGLSMTEVLIVLGLALLLLGPDQLPSLAKSLGKGLREIRKATDDLKSTFEQEIGRVDLDEPPKMVAAPKPAPAADPGEARAAARMAAAEKVPSEAPDAPPALRLVAPEGTVPAAGTGSDGKSA